MKSTGNYRKRSRRSRDKQRLPWALLAFFLVCVAAFVLLLGRRQPAPQERAPAHPAVPLAFATLPPQPLNPRARASIAHIVDTSFAPVYASGGSYSIAVMDASGTLATGRHENTAVTPASTQKLIVASASLALLGPSFRFQTLISSSSPVGNDGTLDGNLYLVGSGDPSLRASDVQSGVDALTAAGLRRVTGAALADASAFSGPEINPHWDSSDAGESYQTATSALSLDGDTVEFDITGGAANGDAASVQIVPAGAPVTIDGSVTTGDSDDADVAALGTLNAFRVSGAVPADQHRRAWLPVHDMPRYAATVFAAMLRERGVELSAAPAAAAAPLESIALWTHQSQPLRAIVHHMLYWSDNHYAEQLLRTLGRQSESAGDDTSGLAAELHFLRSRNIDVRTMHIVDGSGLAASNRVPAIALARILADAQLRGGDERLFDILPAGGKEGTLKYYHFSAAAGRVHAKSGHLSGVEGLAGYVDTRTLGRLAFVFLVNHAGGDPDSDMVAALDQLATL